MPNLLDQQKEISQTLSEFGLNKKDQDVYLGLLKAGLTTLTPLSRSLGLPPTTVQSALARLERRGIIGVTKRKSRSVYEALDPIVFRDLLKEQATALASITPLLQQMKSDVQEKTHIRVFERERVAEILNQSLKSKEGEVLEIMSAKPFQDVIGESYHYTKRRMKTGVSLRSLRIRETEIKKYNQTVHKKELREARFLPKELSFRASALIFDNTVALFSTKSEGAHVMITSKSISDMYRQIFSLLWSVSGTMETLDKKM